MVKREMDATPPGRTESVQWGQFEGKGRQVQIPSYVRFNWHHRSSLYLQCVYDICVALHNMFLRAVTMTLATW
jgi:hypothetical protein